MSTDVWGRRGYTATHVQPDEYTEIRAIEARDGNEDRAYVVVGSVTIAATTETLDRLHEAITKAYELLALKAVDRVNA